MAEGEGAPHSAGVLRELLAVFGFGVDTKELKEGENKLEEFFGKVKKLGAALAGAFVAKEIFEFGEHQAELLDKLDDTAAALGISTERVQQFQFAAKSLGDDADALLRSLTRMQIAQSAVGEGSEAAQKAFHTLGVKVRDSNGHLKAADELFLDVADGIAKQTDASKAAELAQQLFGRGMAQKLLPSLKEGRKGFEELFEDYQALGGGYTKAAIEAGAKFEKQTARLNLSVTGLKNTIGIALLPILTAIVKGATAAVKWFGEMARNSYIVEAALGVLGAAATVFAIKMAIANAPLLLLTAGLAAMVLLVDDVITMFEGGESLIGDAIDKLFGKGATVAVVNDLAERYRLIRDFIKEAASYIDKIAGFTEKGKQARDEFVGSLFGDERAAGEAEGWHKVLNSPLPSGKPGGYRYVSPEEWEAMQQNGPEEAPAMFRAPDTGPPPSFYDAAPWSGGGDVHVEINATVPPGASPKEYAAAIEPMVRSVVKEERRAAAANLQRAPSR